MILTIAMNNGIIVSFPTRRSSDLSHCGGGGRTPGPNPPPTAANPASAASSSSDPAGGCCETARGRSGECRRSEEHTSELQSRGHLVCRLLLEKKKKENNCNARLI